MCPPRQELSTNCHLSLGSWWERHYSSVSKPAGVSEILNYRRPWCFKVIRTTDPVRLICGPGTNATHFAIKPPFESRAYSVGACLINCPLLDVRFTRTNPTLHHSREKLLVHQQFPSQLMLFLMCQLSAYVTA